MSGIKHNINIGIHNKFEIEVIDTKTGEVRQRAQAFNIVTNMWWTKFLTSTQEPRGVALKIYYGTGTGTPSVSDEDLFNRIGVASTDSQYNPFYTFDSSHQFDGVVSYSIKNTIPLADGNGSDITEIGLGWENSLNGVSKPRTVTHAMLQDMNGNPISIHKTNTDLINLYSTVYVHWDVTKDLGIFDQGGHIWLEAIAKCTDLKYSWGGSYSDWNRLGVYTFVAFGKEYCGYEELTNVISNSTWARGIQTDLANKCVTIIPNQRVDIGYGNIGGVGFIASGSICDYINNGYRNTRSKDFFIPCGLATVPPSRVTSESVGVGDGTTTKFKTKTDLPYDAIVYVNSVAQTTGVAVKKLPIVAFSESTRSDSSEASKYIRQLNPDRLTQRLATGYSRGVYYPNIIYESVFNESGLKSIYADSAATIVKVSDDCINWDTVADGTASGNINIPAALQHKRYFKVEVGSCRFYPLAYDGYNIIFDNPPAAGDVITIDYTTDYIPKDRDHVLDITLTLTFGEWQGE